MASLLRCNLRLVFVFSLFMLMQPVFAFGQATSTEKNATTGASDLRYRQTIQVVAGETSEVEIRMQPKTTKP